jgi:hypothetical protein
MTSTLPMSAIILRWGVPMTRRQVIAFAAALLLMSWTLPAQMHYRLKGSIRTVSGAPLANAGIRADAIFGFRGEPFAGGKLQTTTSLPSGEWNVTSLEGGLWMFSSSAPDMLPAVIVIPVKFAQRQQVSAVGNPINWQLPMYAVPAGEHPLLKAAHELIAAGKMEDGMQALTVGLASDIPDETRVAAGEMALLVQNPALAKTIFSLVLQKQPKHPRATLGAAGAALMAREWESAGKILWTARDLVPKEQRPALAAAIDDLRGIARVQ